jgi:hypothetical protein
LVDVFFASLALGLCLDLAFPLRGLALSRWFRWTNNGLLYLLNGLITRLVVPGGLLALAYWVDERQLGALHQVDLPLWLEVVIGVFSWISPPMACIVLPTDMLRYGACTGCITRISTWTLPPICATTRWSGSW